MRGVLILIVCFEAVQSNRGHPPENINDLFPTIDKTSSDLSLKVNTTFDIRKIDVKKLINKIGSLNASVVEDPLLNDTRRQVLVSSMWSNWWYSSASDHMARQKLSDMMLQTIYMTRHIIKELETNSNFNTKDTGYRIGFLYRKLLEMLEKVQDIYAKMYNHRFGWFETWSHLNLHHKSVKLHTDFLYLWWVLVKVDGKHRAKNNDPPKLPKGLQDTGGLSEERGRVKSTIPPDHP